MKIATGMINGFDYSIKYYEGGSDYGINAGRIAKLWIAKEGKTVARYDRGWDVQPGGADAAAVCAEIISRYN